MIPQKIRDILPTDRNVSQLFLDFFRSEKSAGFILIGCTVLSMVLANSGWGQNYLGFWHLYLGPLSISHWINDALMAVFFLLVGLEIERELYIGELSEFRNALLPIAAAAGGMLIPALIHLGLNEGYPSSSGFGIPMATDIAFALGILSIAGKKVPTALKIFLTALAIIDDLGAILIIALFYTTELNTFYLFLGLGIFGGLYVLGRLGVNKLIFYLIPGIFLWYCFYKSGVHATISGVFLAFAIPFGSGDKKSPSYQLQHFLHNPVAYIITPLFALANTGIILQPGFYTELISRNSLGIIGGLVLGKPLGILGFTWLAVKTKVAELPEKVNWKAIAGVGLIAGIGFTMSIFITLLAFPDEDTIVSSKIAILVASLASAIAGLIVLRKVYKNQ